MLTCKTGGTAKSTITFHKTADDSQVSSGVSQSDATEGSLVTTTGTLTLTGVTADGEYYCKATWSDSSTSKSSGAYVHVMSFSGASATTEWALEGAVVEFTVSGEVTLRTDGSNTALTDSSGKAVQVVPTVKWQVEDGGSWSDITAGTTGFTIKDASISDVSGLLKTKIRVGPLSTTAQKLRVTLTYATDASKNFFGGDIVSADQTAKPAYISAFTKTQTGSFAKVGSAVTLTCVAAAGSKPTFRVLLDGSEVKGNSDITVTTSGDVYTGTVEYTPTSANYISGGQTLECEVSFCDMKFIPHSITKCLLTVVTSRGLVSPQN
eukprot:sb/3466825/